jgi:integrase
MPRTRSRLFRRARSPFWQAVWTDPEGHHHKQSTGCRDHGAAVTWLAARELERVRSDAGVPVARTISLLEATAEYLVEREGELAAKWHATVEAFIRNEVLPYFGPAAPVSGIDPTTVARFRTDQKGRPDRRFKVVEGAKPRLVSPATVNRVMWAMAAFGAWCVERKYHLANPWRTDSYTESDYPVPDVGNGQRAQLLLALPGDLRAIVEFSFETGLRRSEIERLRWEDVNLDERLLQVVSVQARGFNKGRKTRPCSLSRRAAELLAARVPKPPKKATGPVWGRIGDRRRAFATAARAAGLPRAWLHLFRHLGATDVGRSGAGIADLMSFGGWSSPRMVQRYTRAGHERMLEVHDRRESGEHSGSTARKSETPQPKS